MIFLSVAALAKYIGAYPNEAAVLYRMDLLSKMSTGRDMFIIELPLSRLDPIDFRINFMVSF